MWYHSWGQVRWTAPSGLTVTEEEFHHALDVGKPIVVFVQEGSKGRAT